MAEGREIRLWGAYLGAEGSTHTGHRQGRRLGKRTENNVTQNLICALIFTSAA